MSETCPASPSPARRRLAQGRGQLGECPAGGHRAPRCGGNLRFLPLNAASTAAPKVTSVSPGLVTLRLAGGAGPLRGRGCVPADGVRALDGERRSLARSRLPRRGPGPPSWPQAPAPRVACREPPPAALPLALGARGIARAPRRPLRTMSSSGQAAACIPRRRWAPRLGACAAAGPACHVERTLSVKKPGFLEGRPLSALLVQV